MTSLKSHFHSISDANVKGNTFDHFPQHIQHWLKTFLSNSRSDEQVRSVVLFGSAARGTIAPSDVDILIIVDSASYSPPRRPIEVDLRWYTSSDVENLIQEGHDLLGWTILFGRLLYERDGYWTKLCHEWKHRVPLPSANKAEFRAERASQLLKKLESIGDIDAAEEQRLTMLTHVARAELIRAGVYPKSRPELPSQLRSVGRDDIARKLDELLPNHFSI